MRLIFPHINGLLSSYMPQILLQPVRIIARKFANRLVPHTAVHLHTFLLWNNHNQYKNRVQLFVVPAPAAYHHTHFLLYGASAEAKLMSKQLLCELHFAMPTTLLSRVLSVHHKVQFTLTTCARRPIVLPHLNNCHIFNKIFNTNRKCLSQTFCCGKAMKHLHHMPQFLLIILFTQLAPGIVAWDMTKVSCSPRS